MLQTQGCSQWAVASSYPCITFIIDCMLFFYCLLMFSFRKKTQIFVILQMFRPLPTTLLWPVFSITMFCLSPSAQASYLCGSSALLWLMMLSGNWFYSLFWHSMQWCGSISPCKRFLKLLQQGSQTSRSKAAPHPYCTMIYQVCQLQTTSFL